jgi:hypothetical protein
VREIPRAAVESVAAVYGKRSAAAKALEDADAYDGPVQFYQHENQILIKKLPPPSSLTLN